MRYWIAMINRMELVALATAFIFVSSFFAGEAIPVVDDLNLIRKEVEERLDGPVTDSEKKELERILEYVEINNLFKKGDDAIREKFPDAVILTTEKTKVKFFLVKDHEKKEQILAIQGSVNLTNWLIDFMFWKIKDMWLNIKLHKGFYMASREIFWKVIFHLNPEYSTTITGHSLGGSCAAIMGMYLDNFGHKDVKILSLGQPRITNKSGTKPFEHIPFTRVAIKRDIVTRLPPRWLWYRHFGRKFELRESDFGWNMEEEEEDPEEALEAWEEWTKDHDETTTPTLEPPLAAKLWLELRPTEAPTSMISLFESQEWKQLSQLSQGGEADDTDEEMEILYKPLKNSKLKGNLGDWFKYHNLDEYHKRVLKMIENFPGDSAKIGKAEPSFDLTPLVDKKKPTRFYFSR